MADIVPPGFAEVTIPLRHALLSRSAAVVFGVEDNSGVNTPPDQADNIQFAFMQRIGNRLDTSVTVGPSTIRIGQDGGEGLVGVGVDVGVGARSGDSTPPNVAMLIKKQTTRGGRRGRGRMFVPWVLADTEVDEGGTVTAGVVTSMNTGLASFLTDLDGIGNSMVILHSVGSTVPGDPNVVTSLTCDPRIATQRRRLRS